MAKNDLFDLFMLLNFMYPSIVLVEIGVLLLHEFLSNYVWQEEEELEEVKDQKFVLVSYK
tara:strand:+ start:160 stop:339 length:180 start_codon:yes stop_codon:yes gene_type:complete